MSWFLQICLIYLSLNAIKCAPTARIDEWANTAQPLDFQLQPAVTPFIGREPDLAEIQLLHDDKKMVVLVGKEGVGKSELARKYAEEFKKLHTGSVVWLNADSVTNLVDEFKHLAAEIGIVADGKKITQIVREVFFFFKSRSSLFVFDAAETDNVLLKYLKAMIADDKNTKVLITSRDENWDKSTFNSYYLTAFLTSEAVKYIKISLKDIDIPTDETKCEQMATALGNNPSALAKYTEYIKEKNHGGRKYTIDDFLRQLNSNELTTTVQPPTVRPETERDVIQKIKDEMADIGDKISSGATQAWEKVSDGAKVAGKEISKAAKTVGSEVKKFFSGFG